MFQNAPPWPMPVIKKMALNTPHGLVKKELWSSAGRSDNNKQRLYSGMTTDGGGVHTINKPHRLEKLKLRNNTKDTTKDNTDCDR